MLTSLKRFPSFLFAVPVESHSSELKCWTTLESDIRVVVEEHWELDDIVDEDGEHIEFQGDVNEALEL